MAPKDSPDHQQSILQGLFNNFSLFSYDKARERADRERDASKNQGTTVWVTLLSCISQLAMVEKLYMNLAFLTPRGFLRKESSVRLTYEILLTELAEIDRKQPASSAIWHFYQSPPTASTSTSINSKSKLSGEGVLIHISHHLILFIQARLQMLEFYEKLVSSVAPKTIHSDILMHIKEIIQKNSGHFHHPILAPIKTLFLFEVELHSHLLSALSATEEWQFLKALFHLSDAHTKLQSWQAMLNSRESKKYSFSASFLKSSPLPHLYEWLWQCKGAAVAKFSLYFYETLSKQTIPQEMKTLMSKQTPDFIARFQIFQRKSDAHSICLILDANTLNDYQGMGYHSPVVGSRTNGLELYPAIFAYPQKPDQYWPGIIMRMTDKNPDFNMEKIGYFFDSQICCTYFIILVDPLITLVVVFESKRLEKDAYVRDFMLETAHQLRLTRVFAALKPK